MKIWDVKLAVANEMIKRYEALKSPKGIKSVLEGMPDLNSLHKSNFPLLIFELDEGLEQQTSRAGVGYDVEIFRTQTFLCFRLFETDKVIRGTGELRGCLEWEGIIKDVIVEDPAKLGGLVECIRFTRTPYLRSVEGFMEKGFIRIVQIQTDFIIKGETR